MDENPEYQEEYQKYNNPIGGATSDDLEMILEYDEGGLCDLSRESLIAAHKSWLKNGSPRWDVPGNERPLRYHISPAFRKLRKASPESGKNLLLDMGFSWDVDSEGMQNFFSNASKHTAGTSMLVCYHPSVGEYPPHWHIYLLLDPLNKRLYADLNPEGRVIGWHDDPYYKGFGRGDPEATYRQDKRHINAR